LRASELLGATAYDAAGEPIGRIADLIVEDTAIVAAIVTRGPWGRLLGYERDSAGGPWLLDVVARRVLRRNSRRVPWQAVRLRR
jgi:sporulation protein YlmC with PRC-barrel domain